MPLRSPLSRAMFIPCILVHELAPFPRPEGDLIAELNAVPKPAPPAAQPLTRIVLRPSTVITPAEREQLAAALVGEKSKMSLFARKRLLTAAQLEAIKGSADGRCAEVDALEALRDDLKVIAEDLGDWDPEHGKVLAQAVERRLAAVAAEEGDAEAASGE